MKVWQKVSIVIGILVGFLTICTTSVAWFSKLATDSELAEVREIAMLNSKSIQLSNKRLEQKIVEDRIYSLKRRIAIMEKQYGLPMPAAQMMQYLDLKNDLEVERRKLDIIYKD